MCSILLQNFSQFLFHLGGALRYPSAIDDIELEKHLAQIDQPAKAEEIWHKLADLTTNGLQYAQQNNFQAIEPLVGKVRNLFEELANVVTDPIEKYIIENELIPLVTMLSISAEHHLLGFTEIQNYIKAKNFGLEQIIGEKA